MTYFGQLFVYGPRQHTERELRVARSRTEYAAWSRDKARKFAAARKRARLPGRKDLHGDTPPVREVDVHPTPVVEVHDTGVVASQVEVVVPSLILEDGHPVEQSTGAEASQVEDVVSPTPLVDDTPVVASLVEEDGVPGALEDGHPVEQSTGAEASQGAQAAPDGDDDEPVIDMRRRSLHFPRRFVERLLHEDLGRRHGVCIYVDDRKPKVHVVGQKHGVMACYAALRAVLEDWRKSDHSQD